MQKQQRREEGSQSREKDFDTSPALETQDTQTSAATTTTRNDNTPTTSQDKPTRAQQLKLLFRTKPLLILAAALLAFHLGNAAVLPLYGEAVVAAGKGDPAAITGLTVVVAQGIMVPMSFLAMFSSRLTGWKGYWLCLLVSFSSLPVRCALAGSLIEGWAVWPVQVLDGVGAGLQSVATPGVVARVLGGTGRVNMGLGAVMTAQNVGAALSGVFGGWMAEKRGYSVALYVLGVFPLVAVVVWVGSVRVLARSGVFLRKERESPSASRAA